MIKVNELRIGNIFWDNYGGYYNVTSINCNKVGDAPNSVSAKHIRGGAIGQYGCDQIEAVPLTEQWLRDFGFFVDGNKAHIVYNESGNIYNLNRIGDTFHSSYLATEIPYVHTLQNHFFFNIGKELTVNLSTTN